MPYKLLVVLHIIGAATLAGGHLMFALGIVPRALRAKDADALRAYSKAFTPVGHAALLVQIITGFWLSVPYFKTQGVGIHLVEAKFLVLFLIVAITVHLKVRVAKNLPDSIGLFAAHVVANATLAVVLLVLGAGLRLGGF